MTSKKQSVSNAVHVAALADGRKAKFSLAVNPEILVGVLEIDAFPQCRRDRRMLRRWMAGITQPLEADARPLLMHLLLKGELVRCGWSDGARVAIGFPKGVPV